MVNTFGDTGLRAEKETSQFVARGVARTKGQIGLVVGLAAPGVTLGAATYGPAGPWAQAQSNQDYAVAARKTAAVVVCDDAAIALDAKGKWIVQGPCDALVKYAAAATYPPQLSLVLSTTDDENHLIATANPDLTLGPVVGCLERETTVTAAEVATPKMTKIRLFGTRR